MRKEVMDGEIYIDSLSDETLQELVNADILPENQMFCL